MLHLKLSAGDARQLAALDNDMSLPAIVRGLIGDDTPDSGDDQERPVCGNFRLDVSEETLSRLETEADQDLDYHLGDMVRVRYLDLQPWPEQKAVALRVEPMVITGDFRLAPMSPLTEKLWIPCPPGVSPKRSLRRWLSPVRIQPRKDEPAVSVIRGDRGARAASIWLTQRELCRVREAADVEGASAIEFLKRLIFGVPVPREQRFELGQAA